MNEEQNNAVDTQGEGTNIFPENPVLRAGLEKIANHECHGLVGVSVQRREGQSVTASESLDYVVGVIENGTKLLERLDEIPVAPSLPNPLFTRRG